MQNKAHEQIDDLFAQIRLQLVQLRQSDPEVVEEFKNLIAQLEDCVESLVIDSLRLASLEDKHARPAKKPSKK